MSPPITAAMCGMLQRRIRITVIQIPSLVVTDRLATATADNLLATPDPLRPLASSAPVRWAVPLPRPTVPHQPHPSRRSHLDPRGFCCVACIGVNHERSRSTRGGLRKLVGGRRVVCLKEPALADTVCVVGLGHGKVLGKRRPAPREDDGAPRVFHQPRFGRTPASSRIWSTFRRRAAASLRAALP